MTRVSWREEVAAFLANPDVRAVTTPTPTLTDQVEEGRAPIIETDPDRVEWLGDPVAGCLRVDALTHDLANALGSITNLAELMVRRERVIANLVANARDAMPEGGRLSLELDQVEVETSERDALGRTIAPGTWICIEVSDTGHGMDGALLRSVFLPLFSTRAASGRGLGLSTVQRLLRRNGGALRCQSDTSQGTTFELLLPAV